MMIKNADLGRRFFMHKRQQGFTMIELIAVMVIMVILASSTIGSYSGFNRSLRLFEEVRDMSRKIQYARDYCIARNESFWLKVDDSATPSTYSLLVESGTHTIVIVTPTGYTYLE